MIKEQWRALSLLGRRKTGDATRRDMHTVGNSGLYHNPNKNPTGHVKRKITNELRELKLKTQMDKRMLARVT